MSPDARPTLPRRQALRITAVAGVSLALGGGLVGSLLRRAGLHRMSRTRTQLGTIVTVTVVHPEAEAGRAMVDGAFAEIERLEGLLSRHRPSTPLASLNREGALHGAPPELTEVTGRALEFSRLTGGAFDVTVAPLLELYVMPSPWWTTGGSASRGVRSPSRGREWPSPWTGSPRATLWTGR